MNVIIGVDGGGSKTEIITMLEDTSILAQFYGGPTNPYTTSPLEAASELNRLLETTLTFINDHSLLCNGICLGMSGIYLDEEKNALINQVTQCLERKSFSAKITVCTEGEISLMAASGEHTGVLVIAGTGSIVYGFTREGSIHRAGGWGHLLGDEGSGYQIGLQTLQGIMRSYDRVIPPTLLTSLVQEDCRLNEITELRTFIYQQPFSKKTIASYAELCIRAAEEGDPLADSILRSQAASLADTTTALLHSHPDLQQEVIAMTGSIFLHSSIYRAHYESSLCTIFPHLRMITGSADRPPAYGAALIAQQRFYPDQGVYGLV
ncbi:BadF/BadG/BcrA/BcrD ATPase family protein [Paenibacillus urinalis]|uniref:N-acetylglucosamine kinase n=1 Tax=Paenibacillus urinalis TaxID=521520 RepID=UPI002367B577|nr:BadF/BadG/BcrA/BcrD ATPase family protein [Paenibacillus urinalis]WDH98977.1 BadF/BadG/BcrA/BcrD ATPase family protein [Paenibacillus urinalis]